MAPNKSALRGSNFRSGSRSGLRSHLLLVGAAWLLSAWIRVLTNTMLWVLFNPQPSFPSEVGPVAEAKIMISGSAIVRRCRQLHSPMASSPNWP